MTYAVIVHRVGNGWNAYVPELGGVVAAASTRERVIELIAEANPIHLRGTDMSEARGESEAFTLAISE